MRCRAGACATPRAGGRARPAVSTASAPRASDRQASRSTRPSSDESVDEPRHAALAEQDDLSASWRIRMRRSGRVGDGQQGVVLGERQVVLGAQLLVEAPRDAGVRLQEGAPRVESRVARD